MDKIKNVYNCIFNSDYMINDTIKVLKLRKKILNSRNNIFSKIIKKFREKKYNKICHKNCSFIPLGVKFKEEGNVCFPHGISGIFISGGAEIGKNCTIFQQVTIGSNTLNDSKKCGIPIIGDNVFIGAGAKIIGNVKIGNNVRIGAGAVVVEDVCDNATVVLQNSKIIHHKNKKINKFVNLNEFLKER